MRAQQFLRYQHINRNAPTGPDNDHRDNDWALRLRHDGTRHVDEKGLGGRHHDCLNPLFMCRLRIDI
jgi:hypothetical protein